MKNLIIQYVIRVGDATSQWLNVVLLLSQNPNESISGRAYRMQNVWLWNKIRISIDWLAFPLETDHCKKSHDADVSRAAKLMRDQRL